MHKFTICSGVCKVCDTTTAPQRYGELHIASTCDFANKRLDYIFFFFQAEDGIRDYKVTGVQTCALPISAEWLGGRRHAGLHLVSNQPKLRLHSQLDNGPVSRAAKVNGREPLWINLRDAARSEERRVGKECRSRWSPYH